MWETAFGAFLGALGAFLVSMCVEYERKPKLHFTIEDPPIENTYAEAPAKTARFLRVHLSNRGMPRLFRWLGRDAAMHCNGEIHFYRLDNGDKIFTRGMPIRWANSDEPFTYQALPNGQLARLFDPAKYNAAFRRDCYPGNKETIDIVARFDSDAQCYGWSNENYLPGKGWRNADWEIQPGRYLLKVIVHSAGEPVSEIFKLDNMVPRADFRLGLAATAEKKRISR